MKFYPKWLEDAVIYQIYPSSFCDSNGDGIGDLNGITAKLDYLVDLGVNTLWLSPIYDSPFRDGGYDVRDYRKIAQRYGTMEDFERLVAETHARDMRILVDFVPGHTSDEHEWFVESCKHARNQFSDRYIWTDRTFYEKFEVAGSYVNGFAERDGNYQTNFFYFQPALNYGYADPNPEYPWQLPTDHPSVLELREEMFDLMRFWLDKGVDGFRVDMAASLVKGNDPETVIPAMKQFWQSVREWWDRDYPEALLLAEWSNPSEAIECGFHLDFMIHFGEGGGMKPFRGENAYTILPRDGVSYFSRQGKGSLVEFWDEMVRHLEQTEGKGLYSLPTGNHDLQRYANDRTTEDLSLIMTFIMTLPHVPTIYYGDEIGMLNLSDLPSKEGGYGRTGARTPMQWDQSPNAGFSTAKESDLYLPIDPNVDRPTVSSQQGIKDTLLENTRALAQLRRSYPVLGSAGTVEALTDLSSYPLAYLRENGGERALILINPLDEQKDVSLPLKGKLGELIHGAVKSVSSKQDFIKVELSPLSSAIYLVD